MRQLVLVASAVYVAYYIECVIGLQAEEYIFKGRK